MSLTARIEDLSILQTAIWQELERALTERQHSWRYPVLASVDAAGAADARTIVLRDVEAAHQRLAFYSDSRSPKVQQLCADPRATLVVWSPTLSWQLRMSVTVEALDNGLDVSSRWARLKLSPAAQDYLSPLPPGTPIEPWQVADRVRGTREHFCVLWATVKGIDWLELHGDGHRRARFDADGARWLTP